MDLIKGLYQNIYKTKILRQTVYDATRVSTYTVSIFRIRTGRFRHLDATALKCCCRRAITR
jgi:hypothetical protein